MLHILLTHGYCQTDSWEMFLFCVKNCTKVLYMYHGIIQKRFKKIMYKCFIKSIQKFYWKTEDMRCLKIIMVSDGQKNPNHTVVAWPKMRYVQQRRRRQGRTTPKHETWSCWQPAQRLYYQDDCQRHCQDHSGHAVPSVVPGNQTHSHLLPHHMSHCCLTMSMTHSNLHSYKPLFISATLWLLDSAPYAQINTSGFQSTLPKGNLTLILTLGNEFTYAVFCRLANSHLLWT